MGSLGEPEAAPQALPASDRGADQTGRSPVLLALVEGPSPAALSRRMPTHPLPPSPGFSLREPPPACPRGGEGLPSSRPPTPCTLFLQLLPTTCVCPTPTLTPSGAPGAAEGPGLARALCPAASRGRGNEPTNLHINKRAREGVPRALGLSALRWGGAGSFCLHWWNWSIRQAQCQAKVLFILSWRRGCGAR